MTRFIQQTIKPFFSRFIPKVFCPACGSSATAQEVQAAKPVKSNKTKRTKK